MTSSTSLSAITLFTNSFVFNIIILDKLVELNLFSQKNFKYLFILFFKFQLNNVCLLQHFFYNLQHAKTELPTVIFTFKKGFQNKNQNIFVGIFIL